MNFKPGKIAVVGGIMLTLLLAPAFAAAQGRGGGSRGDNRGDGQRGSGDGQRGGQGRGDGGPRIDIGPGVGVQPRINVPGTGSPAQGAPRGSDRRDFVPNQGRESRRPAPDGSFVPRGAQNLIPGITSPNVRGGAGVRGDSRFRADARAGADVRGGIANQLLGGNSINLGNRSLNIAGRNYQPSYNRHRWYNGYWNFNNWGGGYDWSGGWGYGPGWGYGGYWRRPFGWGLGAWGLGALIYNSGYLPYVNPYYGGGAVYNYAYPIPVAYDVGAYANDPAEEMLNAAIDAFRRTDFDTALRIVDQAISRHPDDAVLHEFRALVLFAKGDYRQAAATIHSVLAVGPGWNWSTMSRMYSDVAVYTAQLRALEFFTKEHPDDAAGLFLLAYHYLSTNHPNDAVRKLQQVVQLMPSDRVAADLLRMLSAPPEGQPGATAPAPAQPVPQPPGGPPARAPEGPNAARPAINPAMLSGAWQAARDDGSKFELALKPNSQFTWRFSNRETTQEFSGKYTLDGNVLALERQEGGSLVGTVTPAGENRFKFKLLGGPSEDPGLEFAR